MYSRVKPSDLIGNRQRQADSRFNGVGLIARMTSFDLNQMSFGCHFDVYPLGALVSNLDPRPVPLYPVIDIRVVFDTVSQTYRANEDMRRVDQIFKSNYCW